MISQLLERFVPFEQLGWTDIGEDFKRFRLLRTKRFQVLIYWLYAPRWPPTGHDHPWDFLTVILRGGYQESTPKTQTVFRRPGSVLFRKAEFIHNVATTSEKVCWSLVITGPKRRQWGFEEAGAPHAV